MGGEKGEGRGEWKSVVERVVMCSGMLADKFVNTFSTNVY